MSGRRSQRLSGVDNPFFVVPAAGLDADLRPPPPEVPFEILSQCKSVQPYIKHIISLGDCSNATLKTQMAGNRGRGLLAAKNVDADGLIFSERAVVVVDNQGDKVENAIQFALAAERPQNAHLLPLLQDLCNDFGDEVEVFDVAVLAEFAKERPAKEHQVCESRGAGNKL